MKRAVVGVMVGLMLVGMTAFWTGCGQKSAPAGGGAASKKMPKMSDADLKNFIENTPQSAWHLAPFADQVEAYHKAHPEVTYKGSEKK